MAPGETEAAKTQARYDRIAPIYDVMEAVVERVAFKDWRQRLWSHVSGPRLLEVGVGTGKNLPYHPDEVHVTAVDLSARMLTRAQRKAHSLAGEVDLAQLDAQRMPFADDVFDAAVATFVFCSVPDPVRGLREIARVVRPEGQVLLLEHVRVNAPLIGPLMDLLDPWIVRIMGAHIKRHTVENVKRAGLDIVHVTSLAPGGLVKLIRARVPTA